MALNLDKIDLGSFGINEEQQTQLNANMSEAVKVNPDQHAQTMKLSQASGVPEFAVKSNPEQVEHKLKLDQINLDGMTQRAPKTSKFLTDNVNNAVIAQEDVTAGLLEGIEKTFDGLGGAISVGFQTQMKGFKLKGIEDSLKALQPQPSIFGFELDPDLAYVISDDYDPEFTREEMIAAKEEAANRLVGEIQELQKERQDLTPEDMNIVQEGVRAGVESIANMAPGVALTILSRGRTAPLLFTVGAQTYSGSYGESRAEGLTPEEAQWYAGIDAAIEVGTELLPTGTLETILTGSSKGLKKDALKFVVRDMSTEQLATALQTVNSYMFGLDKELENAQSAQEVIEIQMRRQAVTAIATIVAGGTQITAATAVNKTVNKLAQTEQQAETQSAIEQANIDKLSADSVASKLRERDVESFKQFVREADGENNTNVFIDGVQTSLYLQGKTREEINADPALKALDNAVAESRATGADVAIPVDQFMGDIAGTEAFTQLRDHMTMSEETVSPFRQEQHRVETQNYVKTLLDEANENASEYVEAQEIYTQVRDQLVDTGVVNPANASTMAQIVPAWATAQARRTGRSVQEVYESAGLTIQGPQTGELARLEGEQVLEQDIADEALFQSSVDELDPTQPPKNLAVVHNISEPGLAAVEDLGGMAAPSIAVTNIDKGGFTNFGEISLIADPKVLDDPTFKTFDADIYSARQPRSVDSYKQKELRQLTDSIEQSAEGTGLRPLYDISEISDLDKDVVFNHWLNTVGKAPKLKKMRQTPLSKAVAGVDNYELADSDKLKQAVADIYKKQYDDMVAAFGENPSDEDLAIINDVAADWFEIKLPEGVELRRVPDDENKGVAYFKGDEQITETVSGGMPSLRRRRAQKAYEDQLKESGDFELDFTQPKRNLITQAVSEVRKIREGFDQDKYREDLAKKNQNKKLRADFKDWLSETYSGLVEKKQLFKGYTPSGNRKYAEYTLNNVVREMTKTLQGGEGMNYGVASVRSRYANELSTKEKVQAARDKFVTSEEMDVIKEESAAKFEEALEQLKPYYKYDTDSWGYGNDVAEAITEGPKGIREAFGNSPEAKKIIDDLGKYLAALPTEYFETKVQRAMQLSEFDTAVVPKNASKETVDRLKSHGLKIRRYDQNVEGSRNEVVSKQSKLLFQDQPDTGAARGYYDPENSVIRLTESSDLSTFLHEFAHFMYEMELQSGTDLGASINNWYKRNSKDVAAEATKYLNGQYDPMKQGERTTGDKTINEASVVNYLETGTTGNRDKDAAIRRATHEQFARGFETYLMEGKAPSIELRNAFRTFARWLSQIYQAFRGQLNVNLDNEMRQVFDRLLATEEQIAAAESRARVEPMFTDAAMAGMTAEEFADYQKRQGKVKDVQSETLRDKLIAAMTRKTKQWWKEEKADLVDEEMDRLSKERVYATANRLRHVAKPNHELQELVAAARGEVESMKGEVLKAEKQIKQIQKDNDTIGQFLAKKGGLNRESMLAEGVDPEHFKEKSKVFGKPLFPKSGGMTADDVAELLNQYGYSLDANEALDIIFEVLDSDTKFVEPDVNAQIEHIENDIQNVENEISLTEEEIELTEQDQKFVNIKLDHATVKEMVGEERTDKLGRTSTRIHDKLRGMTAKGQKGIHPDEAAAFFGYDSGSQMLNDLIVAPPIRETAEANAEAAMIERHGDPFTDGTIEQLADEAVQNEERGKLILHELKMLARGTNQRTIDRQTMKSIAEERIGQLSFREIHPGKYRKAEIRAAQESARMLAEGNKEGAAQAKQRQALNYYLGMAATEAKNETTKIVDRMARYNKKKVREEIQKAEGGYWEQIAKILDRFEFRKSVSMKQVDEVNQDINTWMRERIDVDGDGLVLHNAVLNESYVTHWKNVAYSDLQGIDDSVRNIEHVARYANKLTRMGEEIEFNKLVDRWTTSMDENVETRFKSKRTDVVEGKKWGRWLMAQMTKIPFMASWLDGGERVGISHQVLVQPFTDAYNAEIKLWDEAGKPVMEAIENRDKETIKRHNRKIYIPEIDDNLYGHQILAVALNTGNEGNLRKLLLGEKWANPDNDAEINLQNIKLQAVLRHMTESDWKMVQMIWDQMDTLYPQLAEVHRRTTGLVPPKVEATPVETPFGTFKGGYYPVKYDPNRSHRAAQNEDKLNAETESMFSNNSSIQSSVNTGSTNERTGFYDAIRLSLDVVPAHFQEAIHYITHHDPVREVNRLIRDQRVAQTIKEKLGPEEYAQLRPWLNDIAKDGREAPTKMFWDDILQRLRFGVTLGAMGFKASTGIIQISGLSNALAEVGTANTFQAMRSILGSTTTMKQAWDFAVENSKVMEHRAQTMDREIKNAMKRIEGKRGLMAAVQEVSMKHIALIQTYMVDLPTWHASYIKGMKEWGDETRAFQYADWVVENVQGSGATKDLARIMRGQSETGRMFTMFMTFFSSLWNMERDLVKGARSGAYSTTNLAAKAMFLFTIPVLFEMMMRGEFSKEDEDEEEKLQRMLTAVAMYPVQSVPFVRDIANAVTGDFGYNISPMQSIIEQGTRTIPQLVEAGFTDEEVTKSQVKGATKFIGAAAGAPGTAQAWATGEHLYDVVVEGEELTMHQLLFGPERK